MRDRMENITKQLGEKMEKDMGFGGRTGVRIISVQPAGRKVYGAPLKKCFSVYKRMQA